MSKIDRKNGVPSTLTTIPLADPHAGPAEPSIGDLIKDATTQMSTLVRAEVELARAEITRDVKKGLTGSVFFISSLVVGFYSTFFFFFFRRRTARYLDLALGGFLARVRHNGRGHRRVGPLGFPESPAHPGTAADHCVGQRDAHRTYPGP